jgi:DNA-binding MarR family transcriptional regulator
VTDVSTTELPDVPFDETNDALVADPGPRMVAGLAKLGLATRHRAWTEAEGQGLTPTQGQILAILRTRSESGMRVTELAEALAVTPATTTVAVQALERKGLVQKTRTSEDGRARTVTLTAEGEREAARAVGWSDFLLAAVDQLTPDEQEVFLRGLVKMIRALQESGEIPISRMCVTCKYFQPNVHTSRRAPHHCGLVNAPFGDRHLRLDCPEHDPAPREQAEDAWNRYIALTAVEEPTR